MKTINLNSGIWNNYVNEGDFPLNLENDLLNKEIITSFIVDFWRDVMYNLKNDQLVYVLLKIKFNDGSNISLTYMEKLNPSNLDDFIKQSEIGIENKIEECENKTIENLVLIYQIIPDELKADLLKDKPRRRVKKIPAINFSGFNLPVTMDISNWGHEIERTSSNVLIQKYDSQLIYKIDLESVNKNRIEILRRGEVILTFYDERKDNDPMNTFVRTLKFQKHLFKKGKLVNKIVRRKNPFL